MENNPGNYGRDRRRIRITRRVNLGFWKGCGIIAVALIIAKLTVGSIEYTNVFSFLLLVLAIWCLNLFLRPLLVVFTLPFILLTLGAGMIVLDAMVIWLASGMVPGITIGSFWHALWCGFLVELITWVFRIVEANRSYKKPDNGPGNGPGGDYIDV